MSCYTYKGYHGEVPGSSHHSLMHTVVFWSYEHHTAIVPVFCHDIYGQVYISLRLVEQVIKLEVLTIVVPYAVLEEVLEGTKKGSNMVLHLALREGGKEADLVCLDLFIGHIFGRASK